MKTISDKNVLELIGCNGNGFYAVINNSDDESIELAATTPFPFDGVDDDELIDNSTCDAEFEKVDDGYDGVADSMGGAIFKMYKENALAFPRCVGIYSADGMYKMDSKRSVMAYNGKNGRAECVAIPQCKMMNSTVLDQYAVHTVYTGNASTAKCGTIGIGKSIIGKKGADISKWLGEYGFSLDGTHVPFDLWCVVGAVYGKALKIWRGIVKRDMSKMPSWIYIEIPEVFETLNVGSKWRDLSQNTKDEWTGRITDAFRRLNATGLAWDLPSEDKLRVAMFTRSILENSMVSHRVDSKEEPSCLAKWGDVYEPCGFKVKLKGGAIFDFCWRKGNNSPSVVQVRKYEHDSKKILGVKGWTKCFHMIWVSWLIQYRNYWKRRKGGYNSCELEWSQKEMLRGFDGSVFDIRHLSTDEMVAIMKYHSTKYVIEHDERRPAHVNEVFVSKRCTVGWTLPKSLVGESVVIKNDAGVNVSMDDAGISEISANIVLARSRMDMINNENMNHVATLDGRKIDVCESVIYRTGKDKRGNPYVIDDRNGRNYSMRNGIQGLKKEERKRVLIDGQQTNEVDYSSLHPHMLYALNGATFTGDVYDVGRWYLKYGLDVDEARSACKKMMLITINAKNLVVAMYSFKKNWNTEHGLPANTYIDWIYVLFDAIKRKHGAIAHEFCAGKGTYLMNLDGKLIREVCHRLAREKICTLAIHNSVVVESRYADKAADVMREEYEKMFGHTITVKY